MVMTAFALSAITLWATPPEIIPMFRVAGPSSGAVRPGAVALFAHHEQKADAALAGLQQGLGRSQHAGDDALGVAGPAPPDVVIVFAGTYEGRHGVHVGGQGHDEGAAPLREHVE